MSTETHRRDFLAHAGRAAGTLALAPLAAHLPAAAAAEPSPPAPEPRIVPSAADAVAELDRLFAVADRLWEVNGAHLFRFEFLFHPETGRLKTALVLSADDRGPGILPAASRPSLQSLRIMMPQLIADEFARWRSAGLTSWEFHLKFDTFATQDSHTLRDQATVFRYVAEAAPDARIAVVGV